MSGEWPPGHRVPPEHELMGVYRCSRMTVSKALSALAAAGLIVRRRRAGSAVAPPGRERAVLEIQDFALEAARAGAVYTFEILRRAVGPPDAAFAQHAGLRSGAEVARVDTLHLTDGTPVALEERLINLVAVPEARQERFLCMPPGTWLLQRVPWTEAEHIIQAVDADGALARLLRVDPGAACLVLERRTWKAGALITEVRITYPGSQRLVGRFSPVGGEQGRPAPSRPPSGMV